MNKLNIKQISFISLIALFAIFGLYSMVSDYNKNTSKISPSPAAVVTDSVFNSAYDGSVIQVEEWLQNNFNDPDSIERIEWSPVVKSEQGNYIVRYKFRAKNESGGIQIYNKAFILGSTGIVISASDYPS